MTHVAHPRSGLMPHVTNGAFYALALAAAGALGFAVAVQSTRLFLLPLLLVVIAAVMWRPYLGYLLVVATLPADVMGILSTRPGSVPVTIPKLAGALVLVGMAGEILYRGVLPDWRRFITPQTLLATALVAVMCLSALLHPSELTHAEIARQITILVYVFVTIHFVNGPHRLRHVTGVLVVVATLLAAQSIFQRMTGAAMTSEEWVAGAGAFLDAGEETVGTMLRTTATFSHPAWLSLFLSMAIPLTLYFAWRARSWTWKTLAMASVGVQTLGVLSTYSRMSYIGVAVGLTLFTVRRRFGLFAIVLVIIGAIVAFPLLPAGIRARVVSIVDYAQSSSSMTRIGQHYIAVAAVRSHPVLGVGPGNFEASVERYAAGVPDRYPVAAIGAHNLYAEVAAELGLCGLAVMLALLAFTWRDGRRLRRLSLSHGDNDQALFWECVTIGLIVFMVSALFVHAQYRKEWWLLLALIAAGRTIKHHTLTVIPTTENPH